MMHTFNSLYQTLIFNDKYKLNYCKMQFLKKKSSTILVVVKDIYLYIQSIYTPELMIF